MLRGLDTKVDNMYSLLTQRRKENYTIEEFAQIVGRSPYTARRWVSEGKIEATIGTATPLTVFVFIPVPATLARGSLASPA
jgi:hypothetical protein